MRPFLTCSSLPHPLHRSAIRSPHRQSHCRPIWAIYAALKPSGRIYINPRPMNARHNLTAEGDGEKVVLSEARSAAYKTLIMAYVIKPAIIPTVMLPTLFI